MDLIGPPVWVTRCVLIGIAVFFIYAFFFAERETDIKRLHRCDGMRNWLTQDQYSNCMTWGTPN